MTSHKVNKSSDFINKAAVYGAHLQPVLSGFLIAANEVLQALSAAQKENAVTDLIAYKEDAK